MSLLLSFALAMAADLVRVAGEPGNAVVADLDRDGRPDLVVSCGDEVVSLLNLKTGWKEAGRLAVPRPAEDMAVADFDGDGHADVALTDHDSFAVLLLHGDGKGGWRQGASVRAKTSGAPHIHGLVASDLNRDGAPDLLFASSGEGEVVALINNGKGVLQPLAPVRIHRNAWYPAVADFNEDGIPDVTAAGFGGNGVVIWLGDGKGGFTRLNPVAIPIFPRPFMLKAADLNADGHQDLYGVHDDHGRLTILLGDGKGGFAQMAGSPLDIGREAYGVQAMDLDGDGRLALATAASGELRVFRQEKDGVFRGPVTRVMGLGSFRVAMADFDGDGRVELAIPDGKQGRIAFVR
jgi:hypothetical protein